MENIIVLKPKDIEIHDLTLLSSKEYKKYKSLIPLINKRWWLRDIYPFYSRNVYCVNSVGVFGCDRCDSYNGVRPLCILEILKPSTITIGDKVEFGGYKWTVLDIDNKKIKMLCNKVVDDCKYHKFDNDTNVWQKSELFDWITTLLLPTLIDY